MNDARVAVQYEAEARADAALTADRAETKYLLSRAAMRAVLQVAADKLAVHRFAGEGANKLPGAHHYVTSIYFDSKRHEHYRAAVTDTEQNVKIRAREYYDLMPSLAELATEPSQIVRYEPWVWFEVKRRVNGRSQKLRFRLDKREVPAFFRGEHPAFSGAQAAEARVSREPDAEDQADPSGMRGIVAYLRTLREPLQPSCIVNYRRLALQDASASLRLTLDLEVGYYAVPDDLWTCSAALVRGRFGAPAALEPSALLEVKCSGSAPDWLEQELSRLGVRAVSYSKFVHAARAVHG